ALHDYERPHADAQRLSGYRVECGVLETCAATEPRMVSVGHRAVISHARRVPGTQRFRLPPLQVMHAAAIRVLSYTILRANLPKPVGLTFDLACFKVGGVTRMQP